MEFGRVPEEQLNNIDFSLPAEPVGNQKILGGMPVAGAQVYVGCAKWGRPEWTGKLYPPGTKEKDFLQHYVQHFNSIELNATHYRIWGESGIQKWAEKAKGRDFKFCPKMYQGITHRGSLSGKDFLLNEYFRGIMAFGEHLGPVFVQVSDSFSPSRKKELFDFLARLPHDIQFFLEVRHPGWFAKADIFNELLQHLTEWKIGMVMTDTAGRRDCAHMHLTIPKAFIRYVGYGLHQTDQVRIANWIERIRYWLKRGMKEVFFMLHMGESFAEPETAAFFAGGLKRQTGFEIPVPQLL